MGLRGDHIATRWGRSGEEVSSIWWCGVLVSKKEKNTNPNMVVKTCGGGVWPSCDEIVAV